MAGSGSDPLAGTAGQQATSGPMAGSGATAGGSSTMMPVTGGTGAGTDAMAGGSGAMMMGTGGAGAAGTGATPTPAGSVDPVIPALTADCPAFTNATITFMGLGGIRIVAGPKAAAATAPMVFYWHGTGSTSGEFASAASAVQQGVVAEGGVLVSFQGTTGGDFSSGTSIFGAGDFKLADQLLACAVRDHNIDPRRIFVTGCSAGGLFSVAMAGSRSAYIAAAAPNSGGASFPTAFATKHTPALMTVHGAKGKDMVGLDFATASATADTAFKAAGGFVIDCDTGAGHCGGGGLAPDVWNFFKAHPFGVTPEPWAMLPPGFSAKCMIK